MKQQTFIAKIETPDGLMVDFYRFGVKDPRKIALAAMLLVGAGLMAGPAAAPEAPAGLYPLAGTVTGLDRDADVVEWTDGAGLVWSFYGCDDWMIGDGVAALMDDNGTAIVTDDVIVKARFAG